MDCSNPSKKDIAVNYIKAMQFKTLIVDDEPLARMRMRKLLEPYADLVTIAGEAATGEEAVNLIRQIHPDLVFLDIQMPDKNGFDVLKEVDAEEDPLQVCMDKVRRLGGILGGSVDTEEDMQRLLNRSPSDQQTYLRRIQAKIGDRTIVIPIENIFRFQSEEKYTTVYASNGKFIISTPLIELEKRLDPAQFVRVHRAHLIAIDAITEYQRLPNGHFTIKLHDKDHSVIPVSRNFVSNLHCL